MSTCYTTMSIIYQKYITICLFAKKKCTTLVMVLREKEHKFIGRPFHYFTNICCHDLKQCKREFGFSHAFGLWYPTMIEMNQQPIFRSNTPTHVVWLDQSPLLNNRILFRSKISSNLYKGPRSNPEGNEWTNLQQEIDRARHGVEAAIISSMSSLRVRGSDFSYPDTSHSKYVHASIL
jgi:hypothetical protein